MLGSILVLLLVIAGLATIFGGKRFAWKLIIMVVAAAILIPLLLGVLEALWAQSKNHLAMVIAVVALLVVALIFKRSFFKVAWAVLVLYLKLCFRLGAWVVSAVTRFPWVLLPQPEKLLVAVFAFIAIQVTAVAALVYLGAGHFPWIAVLVVWVVTVGLALIGKLRYIKHERKGIANLA